MAGKLRVNSGKPVKFYGPGCWEHVPRERLPRGDGSQVAKEKMAVLGFEIL